MISYRHIYLHMLKYTQVCTHVVKAWWSPRMARAEREHLSARVWSPVSLWLVANLLEAPTTTRKPHPAEAHSKPIRGPPLKHQHRMPFKKGHKGHPRKSVGSTLTRTLHYPSSSSSQPFQGGEGEEEDQADHQRLTLELPKWARMAASPARLSSAREEGL